jgi:hypothetical protein
MHDKCVVPGTPSSPSPATPTSTRSMMRAAASISSIGVCLAMMSCAHSFAVHHYTRVPESQHVRAQQLSVWGVRQISNPALVTYHAHVHTHAPCQQRSSICCAVRNHLLPCASSCSNSPCIMRVSHSEHITSAHFRHVCVCMRGRFESIELALHRRHVDNPRVTLGTDDIMST